MSSEPGAPLLLPRRVAALLDSRWLDELLAGGVTRWVQEQLMADEWIDPTAPPPELQQRMLQFLLQEEGVGSMFLRRVMQAQLAARPRGFCAGVAQCRQPAASERRGHRTAGTDTSRIQKREHKGQRPGA